MENDKKLTDLEVNIRLSSSQADIKFLSFLAEVIVTSLQKQKNLDIVLIEEDLKVSTNSERKLSIFTAKLSL